MNKAVLRVVATRDKHWGRAEVRSGRKGTGKLLASQDHAVAYLSSPLFLLAEKVAKECGCDVLVETLTGVHDNCNTRYYPDTDSFVHLPNSTF